MIKLRVQKSLHSPTGEMLLDVDLELERGQVIGLYGKSGAGKTSLLRIIAGLFSPDQALIQFEDQTWVDSKRKILLRPQQRKIGFVFQDYALFPNMTVRQNLEFALNPGQEAGMVDELIAISELGQLQDQYPTTLSGGQQQRVALARSLVQRPQLLLLDEPLSAVDQEMRRKLRQHILSLHHQFKLTTILISHDQAELEQMADQVIVLEAGQVKELGSPEKIFPNNAHTQPIFALITQIEALEDGAWVSLKAGKQKLKIWVDQAQVANLEPQQKVSLRPNNQAWQIQ